MVLKQDLLSDAPIYSSIVSVGPYLFFSSILFIYRICYPYLFSLLYQLLLFILIIVSVAPIYSLYRISCPLSILFISSLYRISCPYQFSSSLLFIYFFLPYQLPPIYSLYRISCPLSLLFIYSLYRPSGPLIDNCLTGHPCSSTSLLRGTN